MAAGLATSREIGDARLADIVCTSARGSVSLILQGLQANRDCYQLSTAQQGADPGVLKLCVRVCSWEGALGRARLPRASPWRTFRQPPDSSCLFKIRDIPYVGKYDTDVSTVGGLENYGQIAFQAAIGEATICLRINLIAAP